jgi:Flp pilus assembly protein TadG
MARDAKSRANRARGEKGAAMVEAAFSMIILLTVMFGIMEICLAVYTYHFISEAAREGTRYAIVRGSASGSECPSLPVAACPAQASDIQNYVSSLGFPGIDLAPANVSVAWSAYPVGSSCIPSASCNNQGNLVAVTVSYPFPLSIPFVPASTINMSSTSKMVISQ